MLPDFLGIGAQRCGTSWLDAQLRRHPQVYLPTARKEIHFFDNAYDRGTEWYARFFRDARPEQRARGEITPKYLFVPACRDRVYSVLGPDTKFLLLLRNPVDRAFSQYTAFSVTAGHRPVSFQDFLKANPDAIERGYYARQLAHWCAVFPRESLLILIHEEIHASPDSRQVALRKICGHLGVEPDLLPGEATTGIVGESRGRPRFPRVLRATERLKDWLRRRDLEAIVRLGKRLGVKGWFFRGAGELPVLADPERRALHDVFSQDIEQLEDWLGRDLGVWTDRNRGLR